MLVTLIVLLIITLLALIFLPFMRAVMQDRAELHENPLEKKFQLLINHINKLLMNNGGEVVTFPNDPRSLNLFDETTPNMIIHFYYSTGTLTITLKYNWFKVEMLTTKQFHGLRQADTLTQLDVANHFAEEAVIAITNHRIKVNKELRTKYP